MMRSDDGSLKATVNGQGSIEASATVEVVRIESGPEPRVVLALVCDMDRYQVRGPRRDTQSLLVGGQYQVRMHLDLAALVSGEVKS
jgi:hypothetical protein